MKEQLKQIISEATDSLQARNLVREYLQARILQFLQENGLFHYWIFHGGTALRFLFMLPRYSEDLDFALMKTKTKAAEFNKSFSNIKNWFEAEAYQIETRIKETRAVKSAFIRFPGLLNELGISSHPREVLSIKIELDSDPPLGGRLDTSVIRRHVVLHILHYDKASFFSGKLHAFLNRPYVKGRDLYDLFWYLSDPTWPAPNLEFLNAALEQTGWKGLVITADNWRRIIAEKLAAIDWTKGLDDVRPFIERPGELGMLTRENVLKLLHPTPS